MRPAADHLAKLVKETNKQCQVAFSDCPGFGLYVCALKGLGFFPNRGRWFFCVSLEMVTPFFCRDTRHVVWQGTRFAFRKTAKRVARKEGGSPQNPPKNSQLT